MKSKLGLDHWSQLVAIKSISMIRNAYEMKFLSCIPTHSKSSWVWNTGHNTSLLKVLSMIRNGYEMKFLSCIPTHFKFGLDHRTQHVAMKSIITGKK